MRSPGLLPLFLSAILWGCTPSQWVRPDATPAQSDRDQLECNRWAQREAGLRAEGFYGPGHYPYGPFGYRRYGPAPGMDPWGYRVRDEAYLADFCMRTLGYQQVPKN